MNEARHDETKHAPFDHARLDRLMDEAGIDVLLATSKHNVQYLLGGHRAFFFDYMDAMGLSRYLPILVYPKGKPDKAAYFGHRPGRLPARGEAFLDAGCADFDAAPSTPCRRRSIISASREWRDASPPSRLHALRCGTGCAKASPTAEIVDALFRP